VLKCPQGGRLQVSSVHDWLLALNNTKRTVLPDCLIAWVMEFIGGGNGRLEE